MRPSYPAHGMVSVISATSFAPAARLSRFWRSPTLSRCTAPAGSPRVSSRSQRDRRRGGGDRERDLRTWRRGERLSCLTRSSGERERDHDLRRRRSSRPRESARLRSRMLSRRSPSSRASSGSRFTRARGDLERERPRDASGEATIAPGAGVGRVRRARGCVRGARQARLRDPVVAGSRSPGFRDELAAPGITAPEVRGRRRRYRHTSRRDAESHRAMDRSAVFRRPFHVPARATRDHLRERGPSTSRTKSSNVRANQRCPIRVRFFAVEREATRLTRAEPSSINEIVLQGGPLLLPLILSTSAALYRGAMKAKKSESTGFDALGRAFGFASRHLGRHRVGVGVLDSVAGGSVLTARR